MPRLYNISIFILSLSLIPACTGIKETLNPSTIAVLGYDEQKTISLEHADHRFQKKYDILEKSLLKEYRGHIKKGHAFGQLYTALDLADFYKYGFINYKKSLEYFDEADELNNKIQENGLRGDIGKNNKIIIYYRTDSNDAPSIKYDFSEICTSIKTRKKRIQRILAGHPTEFPGDTTTNKKKALPEIKTLRTNQYANAIQVSKDMFDPGIFDHFEQDLFNKTRDYFKHSHKISEDEKTYYIYYNVSKGLINAFDISTLSMSQAERILKHINKAAEFDPAREINPQKAYLNFGRTLCLSRVGRHEEAIKHFNSFQEDVESIQEIITEYTHYLEEVRTKAIAEGVLKTAGFLAIDLLSMSLAMTSGGGVFTSLSPRVLFDFAKKIAPIQRKIKFMGESEYSKYINIILNIDEQLQLFRAVGESHYHMGHVRESIRYNKEAINIINNLRSTISSERNRINFARYKDTVYNKLVDSLITNNDVQEAFFYSENSRSRALIDLLGSRKDIVFKNNEIDNYVRELKNIQIYRDFMRKGTSITDEQVDYINNVESSLVTKRSVSGKHKIFDQGKKSNLQELLSLITVCNLKVPDIQALLPDTFSLIEYYISDNHIYAWVMDKVNLKSYRLDITPEELKKLLRSFNKLILNTNCGSSLRHIYSASQVLYKKLFAPLEENINNKQVYIVAHRFSHLLPFEALYDTRQFLVERYSFSYLPSSSLLQFLKAANGRFESLLAFGNPETGYTESLRSLEGAEKEVLLIAGMFPIQKVYLKQKATETLFREEAKHYQVLHIASHGLFDAADPLSSKLMLARDNDNDGMLSARELYGIKINASLVTLSGCETGMSEIKNGDELIGLVRGFFFAGTSSLVASLWKVDDTATKKLMSLFYRHLKSEGKEIAYALQQAKIHMVNSKKYNHPFFWAPFNLYGMGY